MRKKFKMNILWKTGGGASSYLKLKTRPKQLLGSLPLDIAPLIDEKQTSLLSYTI